MGMGHTMDAHEERAFGVYTRLNMGCLGKELKGRVRVICRVKSIGK